MKKSEEIRRNTWRMIAKNLIVLAVVAVVAFVGVMSWFRKTESATADGISAQTKVSEGLEFYIMPPSDSDQYAAINTRLADNAQYNTDNNLTEKDTGYRRTTWHNSDDGAVQFDFNDQEFKFMEGLFLCEVTGDGSTFSVPKLMQYDNVAYIDTNQSFDSAVANDEYLSYDLYFRCKTNRNNYTVFLKDDSSVSPSTNDVKSSCDYDYNDPANSSNDNLKDAAVGAVRMSILNMGANGAREILWIPAPYVYYNGKTKFLNTGVTDFANKGATYYNGSAIALRTGEGTNDHTYYSSNGTRQMISNSAVNLFVGETPVSSNNNSDLSVVTLSNHSGDYYYGHIRVNLWIEGEDAEARLAFVGGKFSYSLNFEMDDN